MSDDKDFVQMLMDRALQGVYEHHCNDHEHAKNLRQKLYNRRKAIHEEILKDASGYLDSNKTITTQSQYDGLTFKVDRNILILGPTIEMEKVWGHIPE